MALSTTNVDIYRGTSGVALPAKLSGEILADATERSAVMQLAKRITLPGSGLSIPVVTGDPAADWVGETHEKPVSEATLTTKTMTPYKIAVIELFSNEFRRDLGALYNALRERLPQSIAKKFDSTVFFGTAPGSNFDTLANVSTQAIGGTAQWAGLVAAKSAIATAGGILDGWALSPQGEGLLLGATDGNDRPLFLDSTRDGAVSRMLGAPVEIVKAAYKAGTSSNPNIIGFAGDWSGARYGVVDGINVKISEEATVNDGTAQINLWQRNMFAVRVEAEVGFVVRDADAFVKLTDATA